MPRIHYCLSPSLHIFIAVNVVAVDIMVEIIFLGVHNVICIISYISSNIFFILVCRLIEALFATSWAV